ncbi:MAG: thioredoxin [Bacilli bacterium]|nr:thioredoxin [Bacilli bacterium]
MSVLKVDGKNFESEVLKFDGTVLVDFYADWCGPCKMVAPILEKISNEVSSNVKIAKVNVDLSPDLAGKFSVMSIPTLIIFKKGKVFTTRIGFTSEKAILDLIK